MSKQVDERVVSMQFDNKHFERNVSTTMSTLDKLKEKLNFSGASKGLENVGAAAKNVNMSGLGNAVETVRTKFSALEIMGVTALANITNSAVNAGKRIVSALTIDPVKTGFNEYELKMDSIKTIMASTGESVETVNKYLNELNKYSDQTIYSFADMTQNIGKFTNAGVKLEDAVLAIKGVSNEAAVSGANAQEASRAMYNFAQALSAGYVKLIDWKSIENANMATVEFKQQLIDTALELGTLVKVGDDYKTTTTDLNGKVSEAFTSTKNFNESLSAQWMTTDVLVKTLGKYADETTDIGKKAFAAAQDVTKLTQVFDILKETAQSGWAQTWELIFGDINQAKAIFTPLTEFFSGMIDKMSDFRNNILKGALSSPSSNAWEKFTEKIGEAGISIDDFKEKLKETASTHGVSLDDLIKEYGSLQKAIGSGKISTEIITETIKKFSKATEGSTEALKEEDKYIVKKGDNLTKIARKYGTTWREIYELNKDQIKDPNLIFPEQIFKLPDAQLKSIGYTEEQIKAIRELGEQAEKTGTPINELIEDLAELEKPSGRDLLVDTFKNLKDAVVNSATAIKEAWQSIFPPKTIEERSAKLYGLIESLNEFSKKLKVDEDVANKLTRTFKGLFAILDIVKTVVGGPLMFALKTIGKLLGMADIDILSITASIGDVVVKFRNWIKSTLDFSKAFEKIGPYLKSAADGIKSWFDGLKDTDNIPKYIISGLVNGLREGIKLVGMTIWELGKTILEKIKSVLGIHSPSTEFFEIGKNIIQGLVNGIQNGASNVWEAIKKVGSKCIEIAQKIDWGAVFSGGAIVGSLLIANKFANALEAFSGPFEGLGEVFSGVGNVLNKSAKGIGKILKNTAKVVKSFSKVMNSIAFDIKTQGIRNLTVSLLILVGAIAILTFIDTDKLKTAVTTIVILAGVLVALSLATEKMSKASVSIGKKGAKMDGLKNGLLSMAAALLLVALTVKIIGSMDPDKAKQGFIGLAGMMIGIGILFKACNTVGKTKTGNVDNIGKTILKVSAAMLLMVLVIKLISKMDAESLFKGILVITLFSGIITGLIAATKLAGKDIDNIGSTILKISASMILLALILKMVGGMDSDKLSSGLKTITAFAGIITALILVTRLAGNKINNIGKTILAVSSAIMMLALVVRLMGGMETSKMAQGMIAVMILSQIIKGLIKSTRMAGKDLVGVGSTILMVSVAIGVLALVATLLGFLSLEHLAKGITAVGILSIMMAELIKATRGAQDCKGNLIVMTVAITLLAAAVAGLSFIDPKRLATASGALSMVIGAFALLIAATKLAKNTKSMRKTLIQMLGVVAALSSIVAVLSLLDPNSVLSNTFALSLLLVSFATSMALLGKASKISKTVTKNLVYMLAVVAGLAIILGTMSALNITASLQSAVALSVLLNSMATALIILSKVGKISKTAISAMQTMTLVIGGLAVILGMMSFFNVAASLQTALALSLLLNAMAVAMVILDKTGKASKSAIGSLAIMGLVVGELAVILGLMSVFDIAPSIETAAALSILLLGLSVACLIVSNIPISGAATGAIGLVVFVGIVAALLAALGGLSKIPGFNELIKDGGETLALIGYAIGKFVGSIVGGFAAGATSGLPEIGANLSAFMTNVTPFIEGAKTIDKNVLVGVGALAGAVLALTAADLISGAASFLSGGLSLATLGLELSAFMINATPFIIGAATITPEMTTGVKALAETILILTAADVLNGIASWLGGGSSLADFASEIGLLGIGLRSFSDNLGTFDEAELKKVNSAASAVKTLAEVAATIPNTGGLLGEIVGNNDLGPFADQFPVLGTGLANFLTNIGTFTDAQVATVTCAANAVKALAEASSQIPNSGGWLGQIVGDNDLGPFAEQFPKLGTGLSSFLTNIGTFTDEQVATVDCASRAIKLLAEASSQIPNSGGWLGQIVGENDLGTFSEQFPKLGTGLKGFLTNVGTFTDEQVNTVKCGASAVKSLAEVAKGIPNEGGWLAKIVGDNNLGTFASNFPAVGTGLKGFADNLGTFGKDQLATVNSGIKAVEAITSLAKLDLAKFTSSISNFGNSLSTFGKKLSEFCNSLANVSSENITTAITNVNRIVDLIKHLSGLDTNAAYNFSNALNAIGTDGVDRFIKSFTSESVTSDVKGAAQKLLDNFIEEAKSKSSDIESAFSDVAEDSVDDIKNQTNYNEFKGAGSYLVDGFAEGISSNTFKAEAKAKAMAEAAKEAAKKALNINSPSKVFRKIGTSIPEGLAMGIDKLGYAVKDSSISMARTAIDGTKNAISRIADFVSSDIDAQPTIRPVLDLSDVESGSSLISNMLNGGILSVDTRRANSISAYMSGYQNGGNSDELLSAIKGLRKDISSMPRNSYNINGITYDDGSNISDAVQTLVRAARIERRT